MYNSPHETESLARVLPGKLLTLDAQCRKDRGTSACFKDDRVCAQLFCFDAGSGYCVSYRPAAEGSRCGDGAVIFHIYFADLFVQVMPSFYFRFVWTENVSPNMKIQSILMVRDFWEGLDWRTLTLLTMRTTLRLSLVTIGTLVS